jgi:transcriptional regulator with XRE-family HTH domain
MKTDKMIKRWMRERGMSQRELARIAGIHESMISRFLNGTRFLGVRPLLKLAKAMGVSVEALFQ